MMARIVMGPVWRMTDETPMALVNQLAEESFGFDATSRDPERNCWLVVHRHAHGVLPSEYDIREVPEELYLAVLARRRELS
jgi:PAS domain-containing protein